MDNAYYILSNEAISVSRLHICTWDFSKGASYIEFGIEFPYDEMQGNTMTFFLSSPTISSKDKVTCLCNNLSNIANCKFIFNAHVQGMECIGDDLREGRIVRFDSRENLTVLPCHIEVNYGYMVLTVKKPKKYSDLLYVRVLLKLERNKIAIRSNGISRVTHIYDFKINETRNVPDNIYEIKKEQNLEFCRIETVFCLHAVPDNYNLSFLDTKKLKNVRRLESAAFKKYLPDVTQIRRDCYNIVFLKDSKKDSYSLFSVFVEETLGITHLAIALSVNILCSLLFALSTWRIAIDKKCSWYCQIPVEFYVAVILLFAVFVYLGWKLCRGSK